MSDQKIRWIQDHHHFYPQVKSILTVFLSNFQCYTMFHKIISNTVLQEFRIWPAHAPQWSMGLTARGFGVHRPPPLPKWEVSTFYGCRRGVDRVDGVAGGSHCWGQSLLWRGKFLKGVQSGHMLTVWNSSEKSVIVTFIVPLGKYIMYNHQCSSVSLSRK